MLLVSIDLSLSQWKLELGTYRLSAGSLWRNINLKTLVLETKEKRKLQAY